MRGGSAGCRPLLALVVAGVSGIGACGPGGDAAGDAEAPDDVAPQIEADAPEEPLPVAGRAGDVTVRGPWIRPVVMVPGDTVPVNSAAYFVLENAGEAPDRLLEVRSEAARRVEVHRSFMEDGLARMAPADSVVVPAGGRTTLEPGGLHVMLMGVREPISAGDTVELTLEFREGGVVTVRAPASQLPPGG